MNYDDWKTDNPDTEDVFYCAVCDTEIDTEGLCKSRACFEADML